MVGKVYIASMNMRGAWAISPPNTIKINVTSAQGLNNKNRRDFSPMTPIEGSYRGFYNFEAFWQSGKVFDGIPEEKVKTYWHNVREAKRRYPGSKAKRVLYSRFEHIPDIKMDYIQSRKNIYVPYYFDLMKNTEMATYWKQQVESGKNVVVYDFDGPRTESGGVTCEEVSQEMLIKYIHETKFPFGHGYIIAAWLYGLNPDDYAK